MIPVTLLTSTAKMPVRTSVNAAAYDLFADLRDAVVLLPGHSLTIPTGITLALNINAKKRSFSGSGEIIDCTAGIDLCALIIPRADHGCRHGVRPGNTPGLVDPDYRGEIHVCLRNDSSNQFLISHGDRIAQMLILPFFTPGFHEFAELPLSHRSVVGAGV